MNSYNPSVWSSSPSFNQYSGLIQIHENLFQYQQYSHQPYHDSKQTSVMSYSGYSTNHHSVCPDYDYYPQFSVSYPKNVERIQVKRPQSPATRINESSSGIDMHEDESMEAPSSNSESRIIRCYSPSLSSSRPCARQVITRRKNKTVKRLNKPPRRLQRETRRKQRKTFFYEKELITKNQSSLHLSKQKHHHSSSEQWEHEQDKLKCLYDEYSSEDIHRNWKPLALTDSRELYQYALDKYHGKSLSS